MRALNVMILYRDQIMPLCFKYYLLIENIDSEFAIGFAGGFAGLVLSDIISHYAQQFYIQSNNRHIMDCTFDANQII